MKLACNMRFRQATCLLFSPAAFCTLVAATAAAAKCLIVMGVSLHLRAASRPGCCLMRPLSRACMADPVHSQQAVIKSCEPDLWVLAILNPKAALCACVDRDCGMPQKCCSVSCQCIGRVMAGHVTPRNMHFKGIAVFRLRASRAACHVGGVATSTLY